jgi:hypothetical protein
MCPQVPKVGTYENRGHNLARTPRAGEKEAHIVEEWSILLLPGGKLSHKRDLKA